MILSKDSNNNWIPTASGNGTFIGTTAAFNAIKDTLPVNTVAYITDDGNGDLQPVDAVTNGDMHPVTSNAVYDALRDGTFDINARTFISNGLPNELHEGGEIQIERPDGSTFKNLGKLYIDSYDNKMRFFGTNSSNTTTMFEIDFTDNKVRFNGNDMTPTITTGTIPNIGNWVKYGKVVHFIINSSSTYLPDGGTFTLPFKPVLADSFHTWWGSTFFGWIDMDVNGNVKKRGGTNTNLYSSFTYITND